MKNLKFGLPLAAILLGAGLAFMSAAPANAKSGSFTTSWFTYSGSGSVTDPANYLKVTGMPACPEGVTTVCEIQATVDANNKPVINTALTNEINFDVSHHSESGNVELRDF